MHLLFSGNSFSCAANTWAQFSLTSETTAAQHVQRQFLFLRNKICLQNPAKNYNKDDFWKPVVNCRTGNRTKPNQTFLFVCMCCFSSVPCDLSDRQHGNLYIISSYYQVGRLVSIWVLPASRWAVPGIHIILVLFASGKWLLSLFPFLYRNCDHWAPFSLPTYHQLKIPLLFTVCSPSLWAAQWWSSCANYCLVDVLIL